VLMFVADRRLVSVGALITILVLVFDTFTQQVLTTEFKAVVVDTDPKALPQVPRSEYYNISIDSREWGGKSILPYFILSRR
jgi:hypothetical protein